MTLSLEPTCPHCKCHVEPVKNLAVWNKREMPNRCAKCMTPGTYADFYAAADKGGPMPENDEFFAAVMKGADANKGKPTRKGRYPKGKRA